MNFVALCGSCFVVQGPCIAWVGVFFFVFGLSTSVTTDCFTHQAQTLSPENLAARDGRALGVLPGMLPFPTQVRHPLCWVTACIFKLSETKHIGIRNMARLGACSCRLKASRLSGDLYASSSK